MVVMVASLFSEVSTIVEVHQLIIPTVLIPLTVISVGISVAASFVAGLFGIELKAEGPRKFLELLLKPRFILTAVVTNLCFWGGYKGYVYVKNMPSFLFNIERNNKNVSGKLPGIKYQNFPGRQNEFKRGAITHDKSNWNEVKLGKSWKFQSGGFRAAGDAGDTLFFGTKDGRIKEFNRKEQKVIREFYTGTFISPGPIVWNNRLYFGEGTHDTHHARIYSFNLENGQLESSFTTKGHTEGQPFIQSYNGKTLLFAPSGSDGLYALDAQTLKKVWHQNDGHLDSSVTFNNGKIYSGTGRERGDIKNNKTFAIAYDFNTGEKIWKREIPASSWMKPVIVDTDVCYVVGEIYFKSEIGGITCFNQESGVPTYSHRNLAPIASVPLNIDGDLVYSDIKGKICRLNMKTGKVNWCYETKTRGLSLSGVNYDQYRDVLVYASKDKGLFILHPDSGKVLVTWMPEKGDAKWETTFAAATAKEEGWYLWDMAGNLRLIKYLDSSFDEQISKSDKL